MPSTLDPIAQDQGIFSLFKGDSGSGKSVGALSWPGVYLFDFDRKMPNIAQKHFPKKDIQFEHFKDIFEVSDQIEQFWISGCPYETLVTDSITSLTQLCLTSTAKLKGEETPKMLKMLKTNASKTVEMMSIDYYNAEDRFIKYYLDMMKALWARPGNPKNIIVIAHVVTSESQPDLKTKAVIRSTSIVTAGRKIAAYIPTQFDDSWHFAFEKPDFGSSDTTLKRIVLTEAAGDQAAKTAFKIPASFNFTNKNLYDMLMVERMKTDPSKQAKL